MKSDRHSQVLKGKLKYKKQTERLKITKLSGSEAISHSNLESRDGWIVVTSRQGVNLELL